MACHERKIRMLAKLRSDYPYQRQESEVSNQDMKYPYRRARTVLVYVYVENCHTCNGRGRHRSARAEKNYQEPISQT